jgi:hypothetical protein
MTRRQVPDGMKMIDRDRGCIVHHRTDAYFFANDDSNESAERQQPRTTMWRASRITFLAHHKAAFVTDHVHGRRCLSPTTDEGLIVNIASEDPSTEEGVSIKHLGIEEKCLEIGFHKHCEDAHGNA